MKEVTVDLLKVAFRKLLSATYYDKTDMVMRRHVALFSRNVSSEEGENRIFGTLLDVAKGERPDLLGQWLQQITINYYPKKVSGDYLEKDSHVITNLPPQSMVVNRLLVKADIPVELCILDVAWLLLYGYKVDSLLRENSYGNRMDLIPNDSGVRLGNALFKKYQNQYRNWWANGIRIANKHLKEQENITIVNFDISNCYHSIDFNLASFLSYYDDHWPEDKIRDSSLTKVVINIYKRYWQVTKESAASVFHGSNEGKHPMPLTLFSAHVLANWYLRPLDDYIIGHYQPLYYGRYVDDCMVVVRTQTNGESLEECFNANLPGLMSFNNNTITFDFATIGGEEEMDRLASFELQKEKIYVYNFNCLLPQSSLDEFVQGQMERSSEFRFLTDEADSGNINLEFVTLVNTLDAEEEPGRRFNILEENRYKLAVYLAKLATKLAKYGQSYEYFEEVDKVYHYFTGGLLIKHYQLWERLMSIYVLSGNIKYVADFYNAVMSQIEALTVDNDVFSGDPIKNKLELVNSLKFHLNQSMIMSLSLHKEQRDVDTLYLDTFMIRMHYNLLPMQEFSESYQTEGVRLQMNQFDLDKRLLRFRWMPYYVKYYDVVCALSLGNVYNPSVFRDAFDVYCALNHIGNEGDWMAFCRPPQDNDKVTEFNVDLAYDYLYEDNRTVSVVEMDIQDNEVEGVIDDYGVINPHKVTLFDGVLDEITKKFKTDIFILPELSLPVYELKGYCLYAAKHEVAFVSGMEYVVKDDFVYNYIITCLPITLYGQRDAVPVIRLKSHYAPSEIETIVKKRKKVPSSMDVCQNLYHWHGHLFTNYYCFELASIKERSFFFSQIDAMYCPVFNKDTYYFNNIAESAARDMHCYFILCNVSHYGDSRVTKPASHMKMNMLKVKGGNTVDNKAVVLSAELDINALRSFQQKTDSQQIADKSFKPIPPNYDRSNVIARIKERFLYKFKDYGDQFLSNLAEIGMRY